MDITKKIDEKEYDQYVKEKQPKSKLISECARAFWVGGLICTIGQLISNFAKDIINLSKDTASAFTAVVLIFLGALFTGLGIYDVIGKYAGAGSIVPITGFANSIVSPALEFKREGFVLGVGAKMFNIAGPVLVYGISASVFAGIMYLIFGGA
ncbi:MAG: stage V sporulation protein AC [Eubacteriales bacterium]